MGGALGGMEKTTVYLTTAQKEALARTAAAEGRSEALLIRAGVDVVTAGHRAAESAPRLAPSASAAGSESTLTDPPTRPRWIAGDEFIRVILSRQADSGLRQELRELAPDTTEELPSERATASPTRACSSRGSRGGRSTWPRCRTASRSR